MQFIVILVNSYRCKPRLASCLTLFPFLSLPPPPPIPHHTSYFSFFLALLILIYVMADNVTLLRFLGFCTWHIFILLMSSPPLPLVLFLVDRFPNTKVLSPHHYYSLCLYFASLKWVIPSGIEICFSCLFHSPLYSPGACIFLQMSQIHHFL